MTPLFHRPAVTHRGMTGDGRDKRDLLDTVLAVTLSRSVNPATTAAKHLLAHTLETQHSVYGVGVDVVVLDRAVARGSVSRIRRRVLTETEASQARHDEQVMARFAAKEAVCKSLGIGLGSIHFHDIEAVLGPNGIECQLRGKAADAAQDRGVTAVLVSWTHDTGTVVATAVACSQ